MRERAENDHLQPTATPAAAIRGALLLQPKSLAGSPLRDPCGVRGIAFVDQLTRVLATAFCANEYLHFETKGRNL
jgi:hypothetical protein